MTTALWFTIKQPEARGKQVGVVAVFPWVSKSQSCLTLCDPMDYTVHGILQVRILEWVAFPFSKGSSWTRNWTSVSCIAGGYFTNWVMREHCEGWASEIYGRNHLWHEEGSDIIQLGCLYVYRCFRQIFLSKKNFRVFWWLLCVAGLLKIWRDHRLDKSRL